VRDKGEQKIAAAATRQAVRIDSAAGVSRVGAVGYLPRVLHHAAEIPPIYTVAVVILIGDGLGNFRVFIPGWVAVASALAAVAAYLRARSAAGYALALIALVAATNQPVRDLLVPPAGSESIRAFAGGKPVTIEGTVVREPEHIGDMTRVYVRVARAGLVSAALVPATGTVRMAVLVPIALRVGDEIRATSRLRIPRNNGNPGEFDYAAFMARDGVAATMTVRAYTHRAAQLELIGFRPRFPATQIEEIRRHIALFIDANLAPPERGEMRALLIGDRGGISQPIRDTFARTGMAHLLVISGLHLGIVAAVIFAMMRLAMMLAAPGLSSRGYANKIAALAAAFAVCCYASIAGHHVSTTRALVMVLAYTVAVVIDRSRETIASLALAAIIICVALPGSSADIGFQLSFASVLAILLGMRRFTAWARWRARKDRLPGEGPARGWIAAEVVLGYFAVSFWAMAGTAPLTAFHFNQFSIAGIAANAIVVPIMGFGATVTGLAAAAMSFIWIAPARLILSVGGEAIAASNRLAAWFVAWPGAWMRTFTPTIFEIALAYAALALWLTAPVKENPHKPRRAAISEPGAAPAPPRRSSWRRAAAGAIAIALVADGGWWIRDRYFNPDLRVTFLSVGEGDAAVVRFPGRRVMLIDGGGTYPGYDYGERVVAPFLWSRKIMHVDYGALSHPDLDHFGGLSFIAENFSPGEFWTITAPSTDRSYATMLLAMAQAKVRERNVDATSPPITIGGVTVRALNPAVRAALDPVARNNASMVLRLDFGRESLLFTGDIEAPAERAMVAAGDNLAATVLKVPHHGSATSSCAQFVAAVVPRLAVISDGYRNRFHFPSPGVVARYREAAALVMRTDRDGAVTVWASRKRMRVQAYRGAQARFAARARPPALDAGPRAGH
jgi:competence protein ComEC